MILERAAKRFSRVSGESLMLFGDMCKVIFDLYERGLRTL